MFSAVRRASGSIFMFYGAELVFDGIEGVESCFHILRTRCRFPRFRGHRVPFSCFALHDSFSAFQGRRFSFASFARPDSISVVPRTFGPVFMFCAPGYVFDGAECVGSRFNVLCAWTHFCRSRGRRVPFSSFALPDTFLTVQRASGTFFIFCAFGLVFDGNEGAGSRFHLLRSRSRFLRY
jgi:hypothetical protein